MTDHREVMAVLRAAVAGMLEAVATRAASAVELLGRRAARGAGRDPADPLRRGDAAARHRRAGPRARARTVAQRVGAARARQRALFVVGYPTRTRPFYTHPEPGRPEYSNSFDLLFRGLELVTGGQRLHRHEDYLAALAARGEPAEPYAAHLRSLAHGMPPHGGFALGLERWTARLTGADNVRRTTLFPRDLHRPTP
ncbi:hypothetical protein OG535_15690 [Kitasatospora sp. NBC_00085]|uniref:amino acid--tRNA ligase-related protein n=2 Tax=unclassified Kitasatospora TaxID=2633591 RepID=UPI00324E6455